MQLISDRFEKIMGLYNGYCVLMSFDFFFDSFSDTFYYFFFRVKIVALAIVLCECKYFDMIIHISCTHTRNITKSFTLYIFYVNIIIIGFTFNVAVSIVVLIHAV